MKKKNEQQQRLTLNKPILKASKQDQDRLISKSKQITLGKFLIHFHFLGLLQTFDVCVFGLQENERKS